MSPLLHLISHNTHRLTGLVAQALDLKALFQVSSHIFTKCPEICSPGTISGIPGG